jgi:DNA-binding CsgD family transcriptional regulator
VSNRKERNKEIISSVIQNVNHSKNSGDGELTFNLSKSLPDDYFPIGNSARFIYDLGNGYFTHFDESVYEITGYHANEIVFSDPVSFIMKILVDEHLVLCGELTQESFLMCKNFKNASSIFLNLEYNIKTKTGEKKRIINQYTPVYTEEDGYPKINVGRMIDITHMKKDGAPLLYIIIDNKLIYVKQGDPGEMIKSDNIIFTNKEIEILKLISEGYSIKQIAHRLKISIATLYTHRKNIKNKSNMDISILIVSLREKGII